MTLAAGQIRELEELIGARALIREDWRMEAYASDELKRPFMPELVVEPDTREQVQELLRWANRHRICITPRGAGTGLSGGALAIQGGVILSMKRMNRILEIDPVNQFAIVEPGVINMELQKAAAEHGLFYPPDPASWESSSLGGNVAEDAGGPRCVKYGVTRNYVMQLDVVLPDGEFIRCGTRTRKGVTGYSLRDLMIGSEGTLGVVTQMVLRLLPKPQTVMTLLALLPDPLVAGRVTQELSRRGLVPSALEFMDDRALDLVRPRIPLSLGKDCRSLLLIELDGPESCVQDDSLVVQEVCDTVGVLDLLLADSEAKRKALWDVRRTLSPTTRELFKQKLSEDVAVPLDRIPDYLEASRRLGERHKVQVLSYGHMGDGNLHTNVLGEMGGPEEGLRMKACLKDLFQLALDLDGTLSAEHGIGCWKQPYIAMELSPVSLAVQKKLKGLFDPNNILNPGKILDWPASKELI
jgi:glycolate oxidase